MARKTGQIIGRGPRTSLVLKLWIDQIARVGRTFSCADGAPKGLIVGKKATLEAAAN